jgi:hypothetical protein
MSRLLPCLQMSYSHAWRCPIFHHRAQRWRRICS